MKVKHGVLVVIAVCAFHSKADYARSLAAYKKGDFSSALQECLFAAKEGDVRCQYQIGLMYRDGKGVSQDRVLAAQWFRSVAERGVAEGQNQFGLMHLRGEGIEQDFSKAALWLEKAAKQGLASSQFYLGQMMEFGQGVGQDLAQAQDWYRKAAEQGYEPAQLHLGMLYNEGKAGVPKEARQAMHWFRKSAEKGNSKALNNLGVGYVKGEGVLRDPVLAYVCFHLSAAEGQDEAIKNKDTLLRKLTALQLEEGKRLAGAWKPGQALPTNSQTGRPTR